MEAHQQLAASPAFIVLPSAMQQALTAAAAAPVAGGLAPTPRRGLE
eukprot:CAMPEP_0179086372 /NCGR_PEP_ID=MMETSP0796-20121207/39176_1 /TAXON_ID=73915 /ORGANISM="Pyrodinium bahamense, Strain pbaha01" /LENGTH=45 /DNA_ID= /DNA_START= /DNA_END= /DNA_ORIENTATION=